MRYAILVFALAIMSTAVCAQDVLKRDPRTMHELHNDSKTYISALEDPQRDDYQKPHEVLAALKIKPGEVVADIGAGSGYFTFRLSHFVGAKGKIYAVDVSPDMIKHINRRIRETKTTNVVSVLADSDDPLLADRSVDRFFICDVWHHIENQKKYLELMKGMLKPGGEIVVIDFHKKELPFGPPMEMKIAKEDMIKQFTTNGFRIAKEHSFLPYQYFLVFAPK
ncbi:MAG TPA: methyltransferase domain-containing protein [Terriglobales bacterium]|nr:methyltransferase domain-containing protein [Terriglobales bacterium]